MTLVIDLSKVKPDAMNDALESACKLILKHTAAPTADNDEEITAEQLRDMAQEAREDWRNER